MTTRTSENPLHRDYWTGAVDARTLSLFRISLGLVLLQDLWPRIRDASTFFTDDGVYPRSLLPSAAPWSLFKWAGDATSVTMILVAGALATLLFTLGFATRVSTAATWVFWVSLHRRVPILHTGGDSIADVLLFLGMFTNLSGRWSLDAKRKRAVAEVHALVPRLMQIVPTILYLYTAREKLRAGGRGWFFGPIIYEHMHLYGWLRPLGVALGGYPSLCALLTGCTILTELSLPVLRLAPVGIRPARALAVVLHLGLQLGILLTMKVAVFTNVMLAVTCLWLQPAWLDKAGGALARKPAETEAAGPPGPRGRAGTAVDVFLCVVLAAAMALPIIPRHLPAIVPRIVRDGLALDMSSGLFLNGFPSMRWEAQGTRVDGTTIDPIQTAAPDADFGNGLLNSLWMQLPYRLEEFSPLGRFVCERVNREDGRGTLARWSLTRYSRAPYLPGAPVPAEVGTRVLDEECAMP